MKFKTTLLGLLSLSIALGTGSVANAVASTSTMHQVKEKNISRYAKIRSNYRSFELHSSVSNKVDGTKTISWRNAGISDKPSNNIVRVIKRGNKGTQYDGWYEVSKVKGIRTSKYWLYGQAMTKPSTLSKALKADNTTTNTTIDRPALTTDITFSIVKSIPVYSKTGIDLKMLTTSKKGYTISAKDVIKTHSKMILYPIGNNKYINSSDVNAYHTTLQ
ncbi:hypothetical protein [Secundilactobacillus kimchicus]|uniref:hypothetical protein n=1 Tax=Secundilactobacillus kimchicus TaxID=528209 RepID=UPI0024A90F23|nr:hypothetical protein [Secundilactobacillus kimchicus]